MNFNVYEDGGSVYNSLDELSRVAESFRGKEGFYKIKFFMTEDFNWKGFIAVFPELPENVSVDIHSNVVSSSLSDSSIILNAMCFSGGEYSITGLIRTEVIFLTKEACVYICTVEHSSYMPFINCFGNSRLELCDSDMVQNVYVKMYDESYLFTRAAIIVDAYNKSTVKARDNNIINVSDEACIEAYYSSINVHSNTVILKTYFCNITMHGIDANSTADIIHIANICDTASTIQIKPTHLIEGILKNSKIVCINNYLTNDYNGAYFDPRKYINSNGIYYKCVKKRNGRYYSFFDNTYEYEIGKFAVPDMYNSNPALECSNGIHVATIEWVLENYFTSKDCAILEVKVPDDAEIVAPYVSNGKLRASKAEIIREVSLDEFGELGKFYKKFARIEN